VVTLARASFDATLGLPVAVAPTPPPDNVYVKLVVVGTVAIVNVPLNGHEAADGGQVAPEIVIELPTARLCAVGVVAVAVVLANVAVIVPVAVPAVTPETA
jgi:hypothetical protein